MQRGQVELPPLIITPHDTLPPAPPAPFDWRGFPIHPYWPEANRFPVHYPDLNIPPPEHPLKAWIEELDQLQQSIASSHGMSYQQIAASIDQIIDEALALEHADPFSSGANRNTVIEDLYIKRIDQQDLYERQATALLGRTIDGVPNATNLDDYQRTYGDPAADPALFKQRLSETLVVTQLLRTTTWQVYFLFQRIPLDQWQGIRQRVETRSATKAARSEAARIAAKAAQAEAARIAAEAAQAEAARIAAEAAQAEAARIAAEALRVRIAHTYVAPAAPIQAGVAVITPAGLVASTLTRVAMRAAVTAAIGVAVANPVVVAGTVLGVAALVYTSRFGDGKPLERYALQLPATDLLAQADGTGSARPQAGTTVDLNYRIGSRTNAVGDSEIFVARTDNLNAPSAVRVIEAAYDAGTGLYSAVTADTPPRTLTWTPAVAPGDPSTTTDEVNPEPPVYQGATITPIDLRIDSYPELEDTSFDDYIIVFPADSGLAPIYTMFKSRRDEPGVAVGGSVPSTGSWVDQAAQGLGAPIPLSVAENLRGREFRSFRAFRKAMWRAIQNDVELISQISAGDVTPLFKPGSSPFTKKSERVGGRRRYEIHHVIPIHAGGAVYDMDNLRILTPRQHIQIHSQTEK